MKIAFIGQKGIPAKFGGVEGHAEGLAVSSAERDHQVFVYVRNNYTDKNLNEYKGVKLIHSPSVATKHLDAISHTFLATVHALFQDYDVVHYHAIGPSSLSFLIKIFKRKTILIATHHCQDYHHQKWGIVARNYLHLGELVACVIPDRTIAVSQTLAEYIAKKFGRTADVIPSGTDVSKTEARDRLGKWNLEKGGYILAVSRLIRHKGLQYLIEAFKDLENNGLARNKKLVIVGDGFFTDEYVEHLKKIAAGRASIVFTGAQSGEDLRQLFSHAYLFVQPSESEGLSVALIEAMRYGLATLHSDIPENMEAAKGTGFSFENKDAEDLGCKLEDLIANPEWIEVAGRRAEEVAKAEYGWPRIAEKIETIYKEEEFKKHNKFKHKVKNYERG